MKTINYELAQQATFENDGEIVEMHVKEDDR